MTPVKIVNHLSPIISGGVILGRIGWNVFRQTFASEKARPDASLHQERGHLHEGWKPLLAGNVSHLVR